MIYIRPPIHVTSLPHLLQLLTSETWLFVWPKVRTCDHQAALMSQLPGLRTNEREEKQEGDFQGREFVCSMNEKQKEKAFLSGHSHETLRTCIYSSKARFGETFWESLHKFKSEPTVVLCVNGVSLLLAFPLQPWTRSPREQVKGAEVCLGSQFHRTWLLGRTGLQRIPWQWQHVAENGSLCGGRGTESREKKGQV